MKTNQMAELEQQIPTFSNPANQMSYFRIQPIKCSIFKSSQSNVRYKTKWSSSNSQYFLLALLVVNLRATSTREGICLQNTSVLSLYKFKICLCLIGILFLTVSSKEFDLGSRNEKWENLLHSNV